MYTYFELIEDVEFLSFSGLDSGVIGKSEAGFDIPFLHYGSYTDNQIIICGGIHARENVSSILVIRQAFYLYKSALKLNGGIYFVPMINPDGALLIQKGANFFENRRDFLINVNGGSNDFSLWKANINAVDLNTNFDADFGSGISNKSYPSPSDYTGVAPFNQAETRALRDFTIDVKPSLTISYHALGRELYWFFNQTTFFERDNKIATSANKLLNYKKIDTTLGSAGGYKDWCIQKLGIPALTIELGADNLSHPLTQEDIALDWMRNKDLPRRLLELDLN